jgi:hypothetical protein
MPWGMTGCPAIPLSSTGSSPWLALEVTPERDRLAERNFGMATLVNMSPCRDTGSGCGAARKQQTPLLGYRTAVCSATGTVPPPTPTTTLDIGDPGLGHRACLTCAVGRDIATGEAGA